MKKIKTIKRYANRKLYDTEASSYVTLDDLAAMVRQGEEIKVIENRTGQDISSATLAQILFEAEKRNNCVPMNLLRQLIQAGRTVEAEKSTTAAAGGEAG